ncbi:MAG: hypothetical protein KTR31_41085, partial [Myxococcales bacterium]|nr:hypothetical protein [Myxococcales bacterium]
MTLWAVFLWSLLLACTRAPAPAPPDPLGALEAQRRVLHAAEEAFLHRRVQQALARGDADAAAAAVAAGLKVAPERFRPLVAEVAPLASVAVAAELWTAADRRMAAEQLRTWRRADTLQRYAESLDAPHLAGV